MQAIDLAERFSRIDELWPTIIASLNGQDVKVKGTFPWRRHETLAEAFLVACFASSTAIAAWRCARVS